MRVELASLKAECTFTQYLIKEQTTRCIFIKSHRIIIHRSGDASHKHPTPFPSGSTEKNSTTTSPNPNPRTNLRPLPPSPLISNTNSPTSIPVHFTEQRNTVSGNPLTPSSSIPDPPSHSTPKVHLKQDIPKQAQPNPKNQRPFALQIAEENKKGRIERLTAPQDPHVLDPPAIPAPHLGQALCAIFLFFFVFCRWRWR